MEKTENEKAKLPTLSKEEAEKQARASYLAIAGINAFIKDIADNANKQIGELEAEKEKYVTQNVEAVHALDYYNEIDKKEEPSK